MALPSRLASLVAVLPRGPRLLPPLYAAWVPGRRHAELPVRRCHVMEATQKHRSESARRDLWVYYTRCMARVPARTTIWHRYRAWRTGLGYAPRAGDLRLVLQ